MPDRAGEHDLPPVHDGNIVGQLAGELVRMLNQNDRHLATVGDQAYDRLGVLDDRRLDAPTRI